MADEAAIALQPLQPHHLVTLLLPPGKQLTHGQTLQEDPLHVIWAAVFARARDGLVASNMKVRVW